MMMEADPRVGFFSVLEVMTSAKVTYRTAAACGFKSHFPTAGTEQKQYEGGEKQGKCFSLLSPGNRRNDQFSMRLYGYRVRRSGSLHGLYGDNNRKVGRASGSRFCSREKKDDRHSRCPCKHSIWRSKCACRDTRTRMPPQAEKGLYGTQNQKHSRRYPAEQRRV